MISTLKMVGSPQLAGAAAATPLKNLGLAQRLERSYRHHECLPVDLILFLILNSHVCARRNCRGYM